MAGALGTRVYVLTSALTFLSVTHAVFLVRPFLKDPLHRPDGPTATTDRVTRNGSPFSRQPFNDLKSPGLSDASPHVRKAPGHNFWPYVPLKTPSHSKTMKVPRQGSRSSSRSTKVPGHNFWPYIPIKKPGVVSNAYQVKVPGRGTQMPGHNFWPYVPVKKPGVLNSSQVKVPGLATQVPEHHSFWPYIPINKRPGGVSNTSRVKVPGRGRQVPRHNFWPFVPVVSPDGGPLSGPGTLPTRLPAASPTPPPRAHGYDYREALYKSMLFYEAQRSGRLPDDRKVIWRGHSALGDRGEHGEDLTGGWYDAGDHVKFGFPMAAATSMLLLGLTHFPQAYNTTGLLRDMYDCVRWPLDYFLKAHTSRYEFYAQVGDPEEDHRYWGRPEDMTMDRPAYKLTPQTPGSDVLAETAAALAAGSVAFQGVDTQYSSLLLRHAKELYDFADRFRGLYSDSLPVVQEFYSSSGYMDELSWAAAWLFRATGDNRYLQQAEDNYISAECWAVSWDDKNCLAAVLLYMATKKNVYREDIERTLKAWMPGGSVDYTPKGLAFRESWGPLRYAANMATEALLAASAGIEPQTYRQWARGQIHYMLGDSGRSFLVGFGRHPPLRPHHPASSCSPSPSECSWTQFYSPSPNPITLYGALVGGPALDDSFNDDREDFYQSEVTCDYNAGFQTALAGLIQLEYQTKQHG
ncbi:uncharacterized protein LOC143287344 [Babylonia areolata]|uniref:uncharacterized protein LOC143287344 n=1 Tax=Babylonia areolata TaxID=304850 RepID=UPI003FD67650